MPRESSTLQSLEDDTDIPVCLPVGDGSAGHDLGGHEVQADRHDGLRIRQQNLNVCASHALVRRRVTM
jgi:hypothetical protein